MMRTEARKLGWFGKLPCGGDFISHNIPPELLAELDEWNCQLLQHGLQQQAGAWLQAYFSMPVHGFVLNTGCTEALRGETAMGVWVPSVDKASRAFPFLVLERLCPQTLETTSKESLACWFLAAANLCARALAEEWPLSQFVRTTASLPYLSSSECQAGLPTLQLGNSAWYKVELQGSVNLGLVCTGLPSPAEFEKLMDLEAGA